MSPTARLQGRRQPDLFKPPKPRRPFNLDEVVKAIWHGGIDPSGTLTEGYLAQLGLTLPDDVRDRVIRHHQSVAFAKDQRLPGMLTLLRDLNDERPAAIVRTYLAPDARRVAQRILGPAFRAAAMFDPGEHVALQIAVGLDAAIRALAMNHRPLWAVASGEALYNLPPLAGVEALTILVETGDGHAMRAATAVATNWRHVGRSARVIELSMSGAGP
jgi:hypothetical protein